MRILSLWRKNWPKLLSPARKVLLLLNSSFPGFMKSTALSGGREHSTRDASTTFTLTPVCPTNDTWLPLRFRSIDGYHLQHQAGRNLSPGCGKPRQVGFDVPELTGDVTAVGTIRILEAVRHSGVKTKIYQASSSEMFGAAPSPQNENSPFHLRSPRAASKAYTF